MKLVIKFIGASGKSTGLFILLLFLLLPAESQISSSKTIALVSQKVALCQGSAVAMLKTIKSIDRYYADSTIPEISRKIKANNDMTLVITLAQTFKEAHATCQKLFSALDTTLAKDSNKRLILAQKKASLTKYRIYVTKYLKQAIDKYGKPDERIDSDAVTMGKKKPHLSGRATVGMGGSSFKQPNSTQVTVDRSMFDYSLDTKTKLVTPSRTNLNVDFKQQQTTEQKETRVTDIGFKAAQILSPSMKIDAQVNYSKYTDESDTTIDERDFGTFDVNSGFYFKKDMWQCDLYGTFETSNYNDTNKSDFATKSVYALAQLSHGKGHLRLSTLYQTRTFKKDKTSVGDRYLFNPQLVYIVPNGKVEIASNYQRHIYPNIGNNAYAIYPDKRNESRIKNRILFHGSVGGTKITHGPKTNLFYFPDDTTGLFYQDYGYLLTALSRKQSFVSFNWYTFFRNIKNEKLYDFFQTRMSVSRTPFGSGFFTRFNTYGRFYTQTTDHKTGHTIDAYWSLGGTYAGRSVLQKLLFGPVLGKRFIFGPTVLGREKDNTDNNIRAGASLQLIWAIPPAITWSMEGRYVNTIKYKERPHQNFRSVTIESTLSYPINDRWLVDAFMTIYNSGQNGVDDVLDLDKNRFGAFVKYLFGSKN